MVPNQVPRLAWAWQAADQGGARSPDMWSWQGPAPAHRLTATAAALQSGSSASLWSTPGRPPAALGENEAGGTGSVRHLWPGLHGHPPCHLSWAQKEHGAGGPGLQNQRAEGTLWGRKGGGGGLQKPESGNSHRGPWRGCSTHLLEPLHSIDSVPHHCPVHTAKATFPNLELL